MLQYRGMVDASRKNLSAPLQHRNTALLMRVSLILLTFMILGMVVLGGLTRLTGAGLSIVEWKPIVGILPPFSPAAWVLEFAKYQKSPEFQQINFSMTLAEFQSIFWLEYIHRLWGRLLGLVLLVPTVLMIFKKQHTTLWPGFVLLWILGLAQGLMGWLMVKSGLHHDPHVSPYRLAIHLMLGFALFGIALGMTLKLYQPFLQLPRHSYKTLTRLCLVAIILVLLTAFMGALVAGLRAGLLYNTFPLMGQDILPSELLTQGPWWCDIFENPVTVQFLHRVLALTTTSLCIGMWLTQRKHHLPPLLSRSLGGVAIIAVTQLSLGILTLLWGVPIEIATLHQCFAFILFGALVSILYSLSFKPIWDI